MGKYDYDLIVLGGGAAGLTASTGAGQLGAKTLLIEKEKKLGGDCLHYGCVPSKSLIKSAHCYHLLKNSEKYGLPKVNVPAIDFLSVRNRIQGIISTIQEHDTPEYIKDNYCVETQFGKPQFLNEHTLRLEGKKITARNFIIATGSSTFIPSLEGLDQVPYLTNVNIFSLDKLPSSLIVLGGGPIGMEMAQAFVRLGSQVTVLQSPDQLLHKEDTDVGDFIKEKMEAEGVIVYLNSRAQKVQKKDGGVVVTFQHKKTGQVLEVQAEALLVATGRQANVGDLDLEQAGIEFTSRGIKVDARLRTAASNIFACGDVNGGYQFTHVAGYEAGIAMVNVVMRLPAKANYENVPWCTYLDPEVASVGFNEKRVQEAGISYSVAKESFHRNDRALAEGETDGFIKIIINRKGKAIGVQIMGYHGGDLIHEWVAALNGRVNLATIAQAIHAYPTLSEISKGASGNFLAPKLFNPTTKKVLRLLFGLQG